MMTVDPSRHQARSAWGITPGYWLWSCRIRVLFVIDGRIGLTSDAGAFGLGFVLETLRTTPPWWVRFTVHVAKRDGDLPPGANADQRAYSRFRFTNQGFSIDDYDQIWFFGDNPYRDEHTDANIPGGHPLDDAELRLLAEWMDRGGGVFATGDHSILGASMCSRIPRVRTMRKWRQSQGVPTRYGSTRHQTLQATPESQERQEEDTLLQPVEVVYHQVMSRWPFVRMPAPHPLLCSTDGVIDRFPDHMHEGEIVPDTDVQLDRPLDIPGYSRPEYPHVQPEVLAGIIDGGPQHLRPRPRIIAYGRTTNRFFRPPEIQPQAMAMLHPLTDLAFHKPFGLIGVYDGDSVRIGRVVVDSTWHHWFSMNLSGIVQGDLAAYRKMQAYYRNVGLWLAKPTQRRSMLAAGTWGVMTSLAPMAFDTGTGPWEIGDRTLSVLHLTFSPCVLRDVVATFADAGIVAAGLVDGPSYDPTWAGLPEDLLHRAVVGGIGGALLDLVLDHQEQRALGHRPRLDAGAMERRVVEGAARAHTLLRETLDEAASALGRIREALTTTPPRPDILMPVDVRRIRIRAETLQLPDPSDPALIGSRLAFTVRLKLDDAVQVSDDFDVALPAPGQRGMTIDLNRVLGVIDIQSGEELSVEVLAGRWTDEAAEPEAVRFTSTLAGEVADWSGRIVPARSQAWRLWYTIEEAGPQATA